MEGKNPDRAPSKDSRTSKEGELVTSSSKKKYALKLDDITFGPDPRSIIPDRNRNKILLEIVSNSNYSDNTASKNDGNNVRLQCTIVRV